MNPAAELSTADISDKLTDLSALAAALAVGIIGLHRNPVEDAISGFEQLAWQLSDDLKKVADEVHPDPDSDEEPEAQEPPKKPKRRKLTSSETDGKVVALKLQLERAEA